MTSVLGLYNIVLGTDRHHSRVGYSIRANRLTLLSICQFCLTEHLFVNNGRSYEQVRSVEKFYESCK